MDELKKTYILVNSLGGGGAERQISYISQLPEIEKILCIEPVLKYDIPQHKIVYLSNKVSNGNILYKLIQVLQVIWKLKKMGIGKNSHLICFLQLSNILGVFAKMLYGCKTTLSVRINPFLHASSGTGISLSGKFLYFLFKKADAIIPNSYDTANDIKKNYPLIDNKIHTIPNGYDIEKIKKECQESTGDFDSIFEKYLCITTAGRLNKQKGQWHLIKILPEIKKQNSKVKLVIMGEGELENDLKALCKKIFLNYYCYKEHEGINENADVFFIGFKKNPYAYYTKSKLFLFPSLYEGLPNALIEAIICNTAVITSNCKSGPYEIMTNDTQAYIDIQVPQIYNYGVLMPVFDNQMNLEENELQQQEKQWAKVILNILNKNETYHFNQNNIQQYSLENTLSNWRKFIQKNK